MRSAFPVVEKQNLPILHVNVISKRNIVTSLVIPLPPPCLNIMECVRLQLFLRKLKFRLPIFHCCYRFFCIYGAEDQYFVS